jgi:DNA-binding NarL/FixJ family response regulator
MARAKTKVVIAHEFKLISDSLSTLIESNDQYKIVGTVANGKELIHLINQNVPDLALIDAKLPDIGGIDAARSIKQKNKDAKVVMLAMDANSILLDQMEEEGISEYITFEEDESFLFSMLDRIVKDNKPTYVSDKVKRPSGAIFSAPEVESLKKKKKGLLTKKEREVMRVLTMESDNDKIAEILGIKPATVITHKKHLIKKLGVKSTAELIIYSFRHQDALP